jgi:class 3 adenylate cyclase/tetratricopeptide (TPR) repeat protein
MNCPGCGHSNPDGAKFCNQCAGPLPVRCSNCESSNPAGSKFCNECAAPLTTSKTLPTNANQQIHSEIQLNPEQIDSSAALDGERKTVTALFADIKGSMELMEDLDPEEARAIVDPALKLMIDAVHRYGGFVVQSTGDGIFALFGAPVAHEDHPQRALYSALRMHEAMRHYGARLRADKGLNLQLRIGVNIGEVVVRNIQTGANQPEYSPIGHSTSLAARLQTFATPGSTVISGSMRALVDGYFQLKGLGPTRIKGVSEPVELFEVTGLGPLRTRLQRAAGRGLTRFVGRQREMDALKHAANQAKAGRGQIVAVMADPGVGKSRLFHEFKLISQVEWMKLEAFSVSHGKANAYLPVLELLRDYFSIAASDDLRTRREKVTGRVLALDRALEDTLPYLFGLLTLGEGDDPLAQMDAQVRRRRTHEAIKHILLRESLNQPVMVIFEDLQWIDGETQALLNVLVDSIGTARILLLVNYRPEYRHGWGSRTHYTQLRLDALGRENAEEMLTALLGDDRRELIPLKRLFIERTEGNPFFIEEMFQALLDDGALIRNGAVKLMRSPSELKIPPTVQSVLAARIDRLPNREKDLLQTIAVIGKDFSLDLIEAVTKLSVEQLEPMLSSLQMGEFIYEQASLGGAGYTFKHALTQEVAYKSILADRRKLLHERAGQALEAIFAVQLDDYLSELARHYKRADKIYKAIEYLGRTGQQAMQRCAHADAIGALTDAIDLVRRLPDSPERIERELSLQLAVGPALFVIKGFGSPEAVQAYTRARELCDRLNDPPELFPMLYGTFFMRLLRGECRTAYEMAEDIMRRAQRTNAPAVLVYAHHALGQSLYYLGNMPAGLSHLEKAVSLYDPPVHSALTARYAAIDAKVHCEEVTAYLLWKLGYPDQAMRKAEQALAWARRLSQPYSLVFAEYIFSGIQREEHRDARAAQKRAENGIALCTEYGLPFFTPFFSIQRGWAIAQQGNGPEGVSEIRAALETSRATGAEVERPRGLCFMAEACRAAGQLDDGLTALSEALILIEQQENQRDEVEVRVLKAELLQQSGGDATQALGYFESAIEVARRQSAKSLELRATTSFARLLVLLGRRDQARTMLAEIYGWFTEGFDTADLNEAKTLLDELSA